jgi:hypothetical protein
MPGGLLTATSDASLNIRRVLTAALLYLRLYTQFD